MRVVAVWADGSPSVELFPADGAAAAPFEDGELPVSAEVRDDRGECVGEITLWTEREFLAAIEYSWVTDEPPRKLRI